MDRNQADNLAEANRNMNSNAHKDFRHAKRMQSQIDNDVLFNTYWMTGIHNQDQTDPAQNIIQVMFEQRSEIATQFFYCNDGGDSWDFPPANGNATEEIQSEMGVELKELIVTPKLIQEYLDAYIKDMDIGQLLVTFASCGERAFPVEELDLLKLSDEK